MGGHGLVGILVKTDLVGFHEPIRKPVWSRFAFAGGETRLGRHRFFVIDKLKFLSASFAIAAQKEKSGV